MKALFRKKDEPVFAAGGIVLRGQRELQVAIVRLRKDKSWVLPRGKLKRKEHALAAARREVEEETGHQVTAHEFLGSMSHEMSDGSLKLTHFWRMHATDDPAREPARDISAVQWLPLDEAVKKLTHSREQVFLANVGPAALRAAAQSSRAASAERAAAAGSHSFAESLRVWFRRMASGRPDKAR